MQTEQSQKWTGEFGASYTRRNTLNLDEYDAECRETFGRSRSQINADFLADVPKSARILELGTNIGMQLSLLSRAGYENLFGVELQWEAVSASRALVPRANVVQGSAFEVPFRDAWFDVVFTSGVLIHIAPADLPIAMREAARCSSRFVWGIEYWAPSIQEIPYRGESNLMWKGDYSSLYTATCPELTLVKQEKLPWKDSTNVDVSFLLEKKAR